MKALYLFMRLLTAILVFVTTPLFAGTITVSSSTLNAFGNVYPFHSSTILRYSVSATSLTSHLVVTADNGFEVSTSYESGFSRSLNLIPLSGTITSTTIFVRFSPSTTGSASGSIINSSAGSTSQSIAVTGNCITWGIPSSPVNYYNTATGRGATLKTNLHTKISGHSAVSYTPGVWNAFATSDVQLNGKVWDIYSTSLDTIPPYEFTFVTDQDNGSGGGSEGDKYNREHSFPQSWFGGSVAPMVSDVHHIFATDKKVNNVRSNYPFGTVSSPTYTSSIGGKLGPCTTAGFSGTVFEPVDEYKGDIARAQLYMITRYENLITGWQTNGNADDVLAGNTFPGYDTWYIDLLTTWHNLDPVSDKEIKRNNAIYAIQNNRNPYIDSPQFVQRIWGSSIPTEPSIAATDLEIINESNNSVTLNWKSGNGHRRIVLINASGPVNSFPFDTIQYTANANLTLAPQIGTGNYIVYNGSGSSVTITNMIQGTPYQYAVIEYNGWYTSANYQSSGMLTGGGTTLPIDLTSFTADIVTNTQVLLKWTTASENNNDYFTIERSSNMQVWDSISIIDGAGSSNQIHHYQYIDTPPTGVLTFYYRLKQTDLDGKYTYSESVSVVLNTTGINDANYPPLALTPNPFHSNFTIIGEHLAAKEISIIVQNIMGETVVQQIIPVYNGKINYPVSNLDGLSSGIYFVHIKYNQNSRFTKLFKQ